MTAFAVSLHLLEMLIPKPLPFMKIGLSNIVVLILIYNSFLKEALIVALAKSLIGTFLSGTLFSPAFLLSISGSMLSCVFMILVYKLFISIHKSNEELQIASCKLNENPPSKHRGKLWHYNEGADRVSIFGLSIVGSFIHLLSQLIVVRFFILPSDSILLLYPLIAVISIVAGFLTGLFGYFFNNTIDFRSFYAKTCP